MPTFYTLLTDVGQAKLANAIALGQTIEITELAVGDGNGALPVPDTSRTTLVNEVRRAPINLSEVEDENPNWVVVEQVLPPDVGGWTIREIGVFDVAGDLIGYGNYPETYKPVLAEGSSRTQTIRFVMEVSETEAVTLKVDPSVVLATRSYSDTSIEQHGEETEGVHGIPTGKALIHTGSIATTSKAGIVEKATTSEAKSGEAEKFPDSADVHEAFKQFGLGKMPGSSYRFEGDLDELFTSGIYYTVNALNTPTAENGYLQVYPSGATNVSCQGFIIAGGSVSNPRKFIRKYNSEWGAWIEENAAYSGKGIGELFPIWDHLVGSSEPENSASAKFIKLSAGEDGSGQYNEGLLTNETITGSGSLIEITGEIATGPMAGQIVNLINSEKRYLAPGENSGAIANDQMQQITGDTGIIGNYSAGNNFSNDQFSGALSATGIQGSGSDIGSGSNEDSLYTLDFDSANSPNARTGDHTNVKHAQATYYMRIA